ncbi:MAG TPA: recombination mediator RecR [Spirochaetota bacterium]
MAQFSQYLDALIRELTRLPGMGTKSASRIAFHLITMDDAEVRRLAAAIVELKERIKTCEVCGGISDSNRCSICEDPSRNRGTLCVVQNQKDALTIEKTGAFKGRYHVLGGVISPLDGIGPDELNLDSLVDRCRENQVTDVLVAVNPTIEGDATTLYIAKLLKPFGVHVRRIARGIPLGADIEYADSATIARSISDSIEI